jgi:predicted acylesterase/phospholipase RssA
MTITSTVKLQFNEDEVPFQRCLVMAGGGFRFAYYLGIYETLREANKQPDVLVASCGASIAASLIHQLPDHKSRMAWLCSKEMHAFYLGLKSNPKKGLFSALFDVLARATYRTGVTHYPDLWNDYLFAIPEYLPLPDVNMSYEGAPALAIVAGRILYEPNNAGTPILQPSSNLFQEVIFANQDLLHHLHGMPSPVHSNQLVNSVVDSHVELIHNASLVDAVRASISDMYYFPCHTMQSEHSKTHYVGGVIDLFPIEIARRLANEIVMEVKAPYDLVMGNPAVRSVMGFNGNERLRQVMNQSADFWVDTRSMEVDLKKHQITKRLNILKNQIHLNVPQSYDDYVRGVRMQVEYGVRCTNLALSANK